MLLQLTIENFLSFKEETTLSLVAVESDENHPKHLTKIESAGKNLSVLPVSAIYGANAAGKSNLIKAVDFAKNLIVEGTRSNQTIAVSPFKLGDSYQQPSKFEFIFIYNNNLYSYGFQLNYTQILQEWLYVTPEGEKEEIVYFERVTSEAKETEIEFGSFLKGTNNEHEQFLGFLAQGTRPNQLFLTEADDRNVDRNVPQIKPVLDWFKKQLTIISAEATNQGLEIGMLSSREFTEFMSNFLKFAGTGINSISTTELEPDFDRYLPEMSEVKKMEIVQKMLEADNNTTIMIKNSVGKRFLLKKNEHEKISLIQIRTQHLHEKGHIIEFGIEEESEGTQRLINLIPVLFVLQEQSEKVVFLDELDRRLHPLLSRQFINMALQCKSENNMSQLIFTTHDTNILDLELFRRDEIWFVEKNLQGASHLYSLAEFKIRPEMEIEKGYLNGRFGAIPFFGDIRSLGWLDCEINTNNQVMENGKAE
jgi:AAA15 family ATPase/GTPase